MAGPIPRAFIDDLLDRADLTEIIGERVSLTRAGREYKGLCPFHKERTPSFTVSPAKGFFHCFGCGVHGSALGFLMQHDGLDFPAAVEALADRYGLEMPRTGPSRPSDKGLYELLQAAARYYTDQLKRHSASRQYLQGRGMTGQIARVFALGYSPGGNKLLARFGQTRENCLRLLEAGLVLKSDSGQFYDRFRDRIMFPIRDRRGRVTGFGGRAMGQAEPKYMNSPETPVFRKGSELYGLYEWPRRRIDRCVLVEGYMDVIGLAQHEVEGAVAPLGTAVTPRQLARLFVAAPGVVFCFDSDAAGRRAAERAMERVLPEMREGRQSSVAFLPQGEDPDSFVHSHGAAAFREILDKAMPMSEFMVTRLAQKCDCGSAEGRARLAELARPLLSATPLGVYRDLLIARLAEEVRLGPERLRQLLQVPQQRRGRPRPAATQAAARGPFDTLGESLAGLVLNFPERVPERDRLPELEQLSEPQVALFRELFEQARNTPAANAAKLLERFRDRPEYEFVSRLLARHSALSPQQAEVELTEGIERLSRENALRRMATRTPA